MAINRIRAIWTGFNGGPGVSTFYSLSPATDLPLIHGFFTSLVSMFPDDVTIQIEGSGDILDETSGDLTGTWSDSAPAPVVGVNTGGYAAPTGIVVIWLTGVVMDGGRLKGRTFLVPCSGALFDVDGSVGAAGLATANGAASGLATASQLVVWHRPRIARAASGSRPAVTYRAGGYASMSGAVVHDFAAVLTSRRD